MTKPTDTAATDTLAALVAAQQSLTVLLLAPVCDRAAIAEAAEKVRQAERPAEREARRDDAGENMSIINWIGRGPASLASGSCLPAVGPRAQFFGHGNFW